MSEGDTITNFYIGEHLPAPGRAVSHEILERAVAENYNMISTHISNINYQYKVEELIRNARNRGFTRIHIPGLEAEDVNIHPDENINKIIGVTAQWIELDSLDPLTACAARQVLHHEIAYAAFCGLNSLLIDGPKNSEQNMAGYCQAIIQGLAINAFLYFNILLPAYGLALTSHHTDGETQDSESGPDVLYDEFSSWDIWNTIRTSARYSLRLGLALQINYSIPNSHATNRWFAEPIRYLILESQAYVLNSKGYPVLTKPHQAMVQKFARKNPFYLLSNIRHAEFTRDEETSAETSYSLDFPPLAPKGARQTEATKTRRDDPQSYRKYLQHLLETMPPPPSLDSFGAGYQDFLQSPLQPLADNLESMTYEVFERDPVKYNQYEKAVKIALEDLKEKGVENISVAVVGAGRGPLVTRCIRAATNAGMDIEMFAIEKNPNAYVHLLKMNRDAWDGRVTIVKTDMRKWTPPAGHVQILVSELLGSFADNELSPECLDGVQRVLDPEVGICIPQSYTAHYTPIMAPKVHGDIVSRVSTAQNSTDIYEVPYVVMLTAIDFLSLNEKAEPNIHLAWEFKHPVPQEELERFTEQGGGFNNHNERESFAVFPIPRRGVIHGVAGYFECVLYQSPRTEAIVELSTRPDTIDAKSKDMISWFAIYFPLRTPMPVPDRSEAQVSFWRITDGRKVWYDWMVETFAFVPESKVPPSNSSTTSADRMEAAQAGVIQKRVPIAASEICSSKKNGCLM
ncbi:hypothetical protein ABW19_dt0210169 [Dactylella cylindrospora]|nr:hypothetical protein ABW19_dt0210169 [Dactylella cylindrospora]